jgi:ATP-binding cassette subfamily B protein RaxB
MVADYLGLPETLHGLRSRFAPSLKGMTLRRMVEIAEAVGMTVEPVRIELEAIPSLRLPAILHWDLNHFVVLSKVVRTLGRTEYIITDPGSGQIRISPAVLSEHFTGVALELWVDSPRPQRKSERRMRFGDLWRQLSGFKRTVLQLTTLSLIYQLSILLSPLLLQWAIDAIIPAGDTSLLLTLAILTLAAAVVAAYSALLRSIALVLLTSSLSLHIVTTVFDSLLRKRIEWFQKRSLGDLVSRFASVLPLSRSIGTVASSIFTDGFTAVAALVLMLLYSWQLGWIAIAAAGLLLLFKASNLHALRRLNERSLALEANESGNLMETIRGIQAIKLFNMEGARRQSWLHLKLQALNSQIALGRRATFIDIGSSLITEIDRAVVTVIALYVIMQGSMTLGMMVAFLAYAQLFRAALLKLSDLWGETNVARVHLDRVSEIASSDDPESEEQLVYTGSSLEFSSLELRAITFRYAPEDTPVFADASFTIRRGDRVAIVGPTGQGKTTLLKIMLGISRAERGTVLLNGAPLQTAQLREYRSIIAVVSQDDVLYSGSILDNITFFDPVGDPDRAMQAAISAHIHEDIFRLPMKYQSLVGDMGSVLSGGQKQRLILARALYRQPQLLFMDEGTSHLDIETERRIHQSLSQLEITRVSVAHRPQAIAAATRILHVANGTVREIKPELQAGSRGTS